jgi:hypothetical protein
MSTAAQIEANRLNAQASTGPTSAEGKAKSSFNALSHGFYSKHLLLPDEDPAELELLRSSLIESYNPEDGAELLLVERIVSSQWKLQRLNKLEAATIQRGPGGLGDLERISRLAQQLDSAMHRAIKALREMRRDKAKQQEQDNSETNLRNEPNSSPNPKPKRHLECGEEPVLSALQGLTKMMHSDVPQFAAAAIAQKSQKQAVHAAEMR